MSQHSAGARFRQAVKESNPLAVVGCVNAYFARLATQSGFKAIYLSGGGVAACSCGIPDLGITTMEDVLIDARRITDNVDTPLLVDIDVGSDGGRSVFALPDLRCEPLQHQRVQSCESYARY